MEYKWNVTRAGVLKIIKDNEPIAIHKIVEKSELPRSTILYNLEQLKLRGLITSLKKKELGSPVYFSTNKANPLPELELKIFKSLASLFKTYIQNLKTAID